MAETAISFAVVTHVDCRTLPSDILGDKFQDLRCGRLAYICMYQVDYYAWPCVHSALSA